MKKYSKLGLFKSKGRLFNEPKNKFRSDFQRDRDRIIHSSSFRRLKHKTQVFVNTIGDHYRTRMTHSIEVAQIARSISKYLGLNDDLAETLSLSHDLGHPPFGHAGEDVLNECMNGYGGFDHNLQTLRIVMNLEDKYIKFSGLNLTIETLDGLIKHNGPINDNINKFNNIIGYKKLINRINLQKYPSLEAQIASISDDIAYNNHDIQDGITANIFTLNDLREIKFFDEIYKKNRKQLKGKTTNTVLFQIIRDSINLMVEDLINNSVKNIRLNKIKSIKDVYNSKVNLISFSNNFLNIENDTKNFLRLKMYNNKKVIIKNSRGKKIIRKLFKLISKNPKKFLNKYKFNNNEKFRVISDFISGMTDRYAINLYNNNK